MALHNHPIKKAGIGKPLKNKGAMPRSNGKAPKTPSAKRAYWRTKKQLEYKGGPQGKPQEAPAREVSVRLEILNLTDVFLTEKITFFLVENASVYLWDCHN